MKKTIAYVKENIDNPQLFHILDDLLIEKEIIVTRTNEFIPPRMPAADSRGRFRQEALTKEEKFTTKDGYVLSLTFHAVITPVNATVSTLRMQLYLITVVMLFMSVLLAIIIAKRVSRPLEDINRSAKILAKGNYDVTFAGKGFIEIEELSDTLNTTATELSKVDGLRRELMANVSHDLRTPLSLIYSYAEMMHDFPYEIAPGQLQVIMEETKRLTSLVNDMLDASKLEGGIQQQLDRTAFNLTKTLLNTTESTAELVKQRGYIISFVHEGEYSINADKGKLTQAYYNLLINAINYSGDDKRVEVRQSFANGKVKIEVRDNGEGIDPLELPYIWDRYYKSAKSHKRAVTGSGIGLSIVKRIFELHGIQYGVYSEVGKGSAFWFEFDVLPHICGQNTENPHSAPDSTNLR